MLTANFHFFRSEMTPTTKQTVFGFLFAVTATSIGGMTVALTRLIISQSDPLSLAFLRYGIGGLVLTAILFAKGRPPKILSGDWPVIMALGVVMFAAFPYCMAKSLEDTTAARGALIFAAMPIITSLLAACFRIEKLTLRKTIAVLIAMAGTAIALSEQIDEIAPNAFRGDIFMFMGTSCVSIFNVFSRKYLMRYGNLALNCYILFFGVSTLFILALIFGRPFDGSLSFDAEAWFVIFLLSVPGGAVMFMSWGRALQLISPTQATIVTGFNPLTAILLGTWLLMEPVSIRLLAGFLLILIAIILASKNSKITTQTSD
ncbi:MAG: DMT family transporter [SAR324 cluster bacterium]|nr:DMT family transporter [SAR324 cluster bacterium]